MKLLSAFMQEAAKEEAMEVKCNRKLDLNLPLLSTRRLGGHTGVEISCSTRDTSNRIPFCWEQAPGKPKDMNENGIHTEDTPRPRLPPCRWQPQKEATKNDVDADDRAVYVDDPDDGCDADVDEDDDNIGDEENDVFSDAIDVLSLTEAIDIAQKAEDDQGLERLNLESAKSTDSQSPNFMIERFLPDAAALAASSAICPLNNLNQKYPYSCNYAEKYPSKTVGRLYSSESFHKGCGLEILFPWRMKHKFCGVKDPVRQVSPNVQQPQFTAKQKKHCSTNRPFIDVNKHV